MGDDILSYNGGVALAMKGKECVAIACDKRYGVQNRTIATNFTKIFQYSDHCFVSFCGLATDVQTVAERLKFRTNLYELREQRKLKPVVLYNMLTNLLYERRFGPYFVFALVVGLDPKTGETFVYDSDNIGAISDNVNLATVGTASEYIFGLGELFFKPNMNADELFEATSQALLNGVDRDSASGWGAVVYVVEKDKITVRELKDNLGKEMKSLTLYFYEYLSRDSNRVFQANMRFQHGGSSFGRWMDVLATSTLLSAYALRKLSAAELAQCLQTLMRLKYHP